MNLNDIHIPNSYTKNSRHHVDYIIKYIFELSPIPQSARIMPDLQLSEVPNIIATIDPIILDFGYIDSFNN